MCSWLLKSKFLGFLERSLATAMGCFIGCFRVRDADRRSSPVVSDHSISISSEPVRSSTRNRLSSFLLFEAEEKDCSPCKDEKLQVTGSPVTDFDVKELKDEATFLKACGTLSQTPAEIRKASKKLKDSILQDDDSESSNFHSWLPSTSIQKLNLVEQPDQPSTPTKLREEWLNGFSSSAHSASSSCITGQDTGRNYSSCAEGCEVGNSASTIDMHDTVMCNSAASTVSPMPSAACVQSRNKSVRFNCQSDASSYSSSETSETSKQPGSVRDQDVPKRSPYPTPLKLTDDMQTPGTVFPSYMHSLEAGKKPRIRSQYVYPVLNPVENFSQLKALTEEASYSDQLSRQLPESIEETDKEICSSEIESRGSSAVKEVNLEASLSTWLKPKPTNQGGGDRLTTASLGHADFGKTPGDRPILGMVAAHWNNDETSSISPKWWDGNGIPNSTNKYKEDQKVSWHATPFEERLEKALSEDSFISGRKHLDLEGTPPINFDENEKDSAESELQPCSSHMKSVVSF